MIHDPRALAIAFILTAVRSLAPFAADAAPPPSVLVALAPASGNDARGAVPVGPEGQIFEPDGKGEWVSHRAITTAETLTIAGRAGAAVVATGEGVVYRLAANGWSALRLTQKGGAVMSGGSRSVAAVGRQLFALDRMAGGEPVKLAIAPTPVLAIGSSHRGVVVATEAGLLRLRGAVFTPIKRAPRQVNELISDTWALVDHGAVDLRSGTTTRWPTGLTVLRAAAGPADSLVAVGQASAGFELVTLRAGKLLRDPIVVEAAAVAGHPVGIATDRAGRVVVAFRDGRLAIRNRGTWTLTTVRVAPPEPHPGPPPATSR